MLFYFAVYDYNFYNFLIVFINLDPKNGKSMILSILSVRKQFLLVKSFSSR